MTKVKIPGLYVLMNSKIQEIYESVLKSIYNIISHNDSLNSNVKIITSDSEDALVNSIKIIFPKVDRIGCMHHFKMDIIKNLKLYKLYNLFNYNDIILDFGKLPFIY